MSAVRLRRCAGTIGLLLWFALPVRAQGPAAATVGFRDSLSSTLLHEVRKLQISLPEGYAAGALRYPVVYLLDGESHFLHTAASIQFLVREGRIPPLILVAISNTDRTRDLTPETHGTDAGQFPTAGGARTFLRFMSEELFPYVEGRYRTENLRVLIGHSFGGLFAIEALQTSPELFRGYIVMSPSLWWDGMSHADRAAADLRERPDLRAWVYMTTGNEGGEMLLGAERLAGAFAAAAPPGLEWKFVHMAGEVHGSIPLRTTIDGLEFIFGDMRVTREVLETIVAAGLPGLDRHYHELSKRYGYRIETPEAFINQLGYIYLNSGRSAEAIDVFRENARRFPRSANTYDSLGDAYLAAGMISESIESFSNAIRLGTLTHDPVVPFSVRKLQNAESQAKAGTRGP